MKADLSTKQGIEIFNEAERRASRYAPKPPIEPFTAGLVGFAAAIATILLNGQGIMPWVLGGIFTLGPPIVVVLLEDRHAKASRREQATVEAEFEHYGQIYRQDQT